jgi:hypothetical protein
MKTAHMPIKNGKDPDLGGGQSASCGKNADMKDKIKPS